MLAARFYGNRDVRVEEVEKPACGPLDVLIKVVYAGICGSDLHVYEKGMFVTATPVTMGHEFVGIVEKVGEQVSGIKPGDHVVGDPRVSCGQCAWCAAGSYNLCPALGFIGEVAPGCFAEYLTLQRHKVLVVPPAISLERAALIEPLAVAIHIAEQARCKETTSMGVIGAGPIGLLAMMVAREVYQVADITVVDKSPLRLEMASKAGALKCFDSLASPLAFDLLIEAAGKGITLNKALQWLNPGGRLVMAGLYEEKVACDPNEIVAKELKLVGVNAYSSANLQQAIALLAEGRVDVSAIVSHILPLAAAVEGLSLAASAEKKAVKILLKP